MDIALPAPTVRACVAVEVYPADQWPALAAQWNAILARSDAHSIFLTSDWIESWLGVFGDQLKPDIVILKEDGDAIGACLLVRRTEPRGPFRVRRIYLNASGEDAADETVIEGNTLVCVAGKEDAAAEALANHIRRQRWDEFVMTGCWRTPVISALRTRFPDATDSVETWHSRYIDVRTLRESGASYEGTLSQKTRYNIRQSIKLYEQSGERLSIHTAATQAEALQMLDELAELHERRWAAREGAGAFASRRFIAVHRDFVRRSFGKGKVQLVRVSVGSEPIGVLYNFVQGSTVYFYQCGFCYADNKRLRPGLVTLFAVTREYVSGTDVDEFDLMAGDTEYKRSLSKDSRQMDWIVIERATWKNRLIKLVRAGKRRWRAARQRTEAAESADT